MKLIKLDDVLEIKESEKYICGSYNVPMISIKGKYEGMPSVYLTPFRYCGFYISSSENSKWDYVPSRRWSSTKQELLMPQLLEAINIYLNKENPGFSVAIADGDTVFTSMNYTINDFDCIIQLSEIQETELWKTLVKFINESYESLMSYVGRVIYIREVG